MGPILHPEVYLILKTFSQAFLQQLQLLFLSQHILGNNSQAQLVKMPVFQLWDATSLLCYEGHKGCDDGFLTRVMGEST